MKTLYNTYEGLLDTDFSQEGIDNKTNNIKTEYINGMLERLFGARIRMCVNMMIKIKSYILLIRGHL